MPASADPPPRAMDAGDTTASALLRHPSAFVPIVMSLAALAMVAWHVAAYGTAPQPDEVTQVHLWQLLMGAQLPIVLFFALRWLPRAPRPALIVLAIQLGGAVLAIAPVAVLDGL